MSSVEKHGHHKCGGSLLTLTKVLTACHCVCDFHRESASSKMYVTSSSPSYFSIKIGHPDLKSSSSTVQSRNAKSLLLHPKCAMSHGLMEWDFGIIVTSEPFNSTEHVHPFKLYSTNETLFEMLISNITDRTKCWVLGWGTPERGSPKMSRYLKMALMKIIHPGKCRNLLSTRWFISDSYDFSSKASICVLGVNTSDSDCTGDSGGPFVCEGIVVGIVSYG
ncbi:unnamed protein product, partial [Nesidiocoris tenuis]